MGFSNFDRLPLNELLAQAQAQPEDDTPAMNEVVRRFDKLAMKVAASTSGDVALQEDLANAARLAVVRAVRNHDGRPGFVGYVRRYLKGAALHELALWVTPGALVDTTSTAAMEEMDPKVLEQKMLTDNVVTIDGWGDGEMGDAVAKLSVAQQELVLLRYVDDLALAEIANLAGTSVSAISQRLATCHRHLALQIAA